MAHNGQGPLVTTFTLGTDSPDKIAGGARGFAQARSIKIKLSGELDIEKGARAVRDRDVSRCASMRPAEN